MNRVVATGIGLTTALGSSALTTWQRLVAGESAIALRQPFLALAPMPLAMAEKHPQPLNKIIQTSVEEAWHDAGISDTDLSLTDRPAAGLSNDCGVVIGSSRSHLREWERMATSQATSQGQQPSTDLRQPLSELTGADWLAALPHSPALMAARLVGAGGPVLAPMAACATGVWAIAQAADLIRSGQCSRVIAGAVESPITPLTMAGFRKMGALATTGCYPFDVAREGFVLGEGGAVIVLESAELAASRGAPHIYGEVLAAGITNDSYHVSSFEPTYDMGKRALALCLARSGLTPHEVDAVHVHGTSTQQNDRMEASLIEHQLGRHVPVMATKGATGHTLGASGALIVALSLMSLRAQQVVPCVGLREAEFDVNFVRGAEQRALEKMLCFSFGFGGQNAVLAMAAA